MSTHSTPDLFSSFQLGRYRLPNRIVMAPMTRLRALDSIPTDLMATYYAQRSSAGLMITECTMVSPLSQGYINCPGIYAPEHVNGWKKVTQAVHSKGGKIFLQLWHSGRVAHPALLNGELPVAPSAIAAEGSLHTPIGKVTLEAPRALATAEILEIIRQFRQGAANAIEAGFDGVELHGAFGYLIDQFLQDGSNQRSDAYGGSIENRSRFLLEIVDAVCAEVGGDRVGIKLSPSNTFYGVADSNPQALFSYILEHLSSFNLAYVHLMEPNDTDLKTGRVIESVLSTFASDYPGTIITNGNYTKENGNEALANQGADLVSFGRPYISNPDLPQRFANGAELTPPDVSTFYGVGTSNLEKGYTDYPTLADL